jgi:hypothetical protein
MSLSKLFIAVPASVDEGLLNRSYWIRLSESRRSCKHRDGLSSIIDHEKFSPNLEVAIGLDGESGSKRDRVRATSRACHEHGIATRIEASV